MKECPFCGSKTEKNANRCFSCGGWLVGGVKVKRCPSCESGNQQSSTECRKCGEPLPIVINDNSAPIPTNNPKQPKEWVEHLINSSLLIPAGFAVLIALVFIAAGNFGGLKYLLAAIVLYWIVRIAVGAVRSDMYDLLNNIRQLESRIEDLEARADDLESK